MNNNGYITHQEKQFRIYEDRCRRCGLCCGAEDGDPCINLVKNIDGKYSCKVYENRIGQQKTLSGKVFSCVPMKQVIMYSGTRPGCAYSK